MAFVRKRSHSKYWYACITGPDGKRKDFSTELEDEAEAYALAVAAESALRRNQNRPQQIRAALMRIADEYACGDEKTPDAGQWIRDWAAGKKNEVGKGTFSTYTSMAEDVATWLEQKRIKHLESLTVEHVKEIRGIWASKNSNSTANQKVLNLRLALGQAVRSGLIRTSPANDLRKLKESKPKRRPFSRHELDIVAPALDGPRMSEWKAAFYLGLISGQRFGDVAGIRGNNLDLVEATVSLVTSKTSRVVSLPLMGPALDAIMALPLSDDPKDFVMPGLATMSQSARSTKFREILASVGLAQPIPKKRKKTADEPRKGRNETSELSFHSLRHTLTTMLKSSGVSDSIARAIIGHESVAQSQAYTHLDLETMRTALTKALNHHGI